MLEPLSARVLYGLLVVSMLTNVVVIARTASFDWHRLVHREQAVPDLTDGEHIRGRSDAPVTIIEYVDFQCPFCARFHDVIKAAVAEDPRVRWVFRHLPLRDIHPMAAAAAEAAECASRQHRFWEYADRLFERQQEIDEARLMGIGRDLNLDERLFAACRQSQWVRRKVAADAQAFEEGHLSGTPTWFVNGVRFEGTVAAEELRRVIAGAR